MNCNILIVEDESRIRRMLRSYFEEENWTVYEAENGVKALEVVNENGIDIVILDIMMPLMDGMETIKKIRAKSNINVIMLTALSDEESEIACYNYGADDFVQKPFKIKVLVAKVKRIMEKKEENIASGKYKYLDFEIDFLARKVFLDQKEISFSPKEYDLLEYLVKHKNIVKTRDQIIDKVWGFDFDGETRVVDRHILKVRNKLQLKHINIATVISKGYRYEEI